MKTATYLLMKTTRFLLLTLSLALGLALPAGAATTALSGLPNASSVTTNDDLILNATNSGAGTWTTKRATVAKVAAAMNNLIGVQNPLTNPVFKTTDSIGRMWLTNGDVVAYRGEGTSPNQLHLAFTNKNTWTDGGTSFLTFMGGYNPNDVAYIYYIPDHGAGAYGRAPELLTDLPNGSIAYYYDWVQWGAGPARWRPTWHEWPGSRNTMLRDNVLNTNIWDTSFFHVPQVRVYTNLVGQAPAFVYAGSASDSVYPAFAFIGVGTNGSGAWVWYDKFGGVVDAPVPDGQKHRNYDSAVERFRITSGPDAASAAAKVVGTMVADDFRLSNGRPLSNSIVQVGYGTFSNGTAIVLTTNIHTTSIVQLSYISTDGTVSALGESLADRVAGTSFKLLSGKTNDGNMFSWSLVENSAALVNSAGIQPDSVAGLLFWYKGNAQPVHSNGANTNWLDSTTNHYDAALKFDAAPSQWPYYTNQAINNLAGFWCVGDKSAWTNNLTVATSNFTGFVVCHPATNSRPYQRIIDQHFTTDFTWIEATNTTWFWWRGGDTVLASPVAYGARAVCVRRTGTALLIKNTVAQTTGTLSGEVEGVNKVGIGDQATEGTTFGFTGALAEVIWYNTNLSDDQVTAILLHLKIKYGL